MVHPALPLVLQDIFVSTKRLLLQFAQKDFSVEIRLLFQSNVPRVHIVSEGCQLEQSAQLGLIAQKVQPCPLLVHQVLIAWRRQKHSHHVHLEHFV